MRIHTAFAMLAVSVAPTLFAQEEVPRANPFELAEALERDMAETRASTGPTPRTRPPSGPSSGPSARGSTAPPRA